MAKSVLQQRVDHLEALYQQLETAKREEREAIAKQINEVEMDLMSIGML